MVFNRPLAATGHKNHVADARFVSLFHGILDQRFVHHRQHFFGAGFGGGQKARAQTSDRKYGFLKGACHGVKWGFDGNYFLVIQGRYPKRLS